MFPSQIRIHGPIKRKIICIKGQTRRRTKERLLPCRGKVVSSPGMKLTMTFYSGSRAVRNKPYLLAQQQFRTRPQRHSYRNRDTFALTLITYLS